MVKTGKRILIGLLMLALLLPSSAAFAEPKATAPVFVPGDVDLDGDVTATDARLALRASVRLEDYNPCSCEAAAADMNTDGDILASDARIILRMSVDLETPAPRTKKSCRLFSLSVPSAMLEKMVVETTDTSVSFYHKASRAAGLDDFLFRVSALPAEGILEKLDGSVFAFLLDGETERCVLITYPPMNGDRSDRYTEERAGLQNAAKSITGTFEPASWHDYPYFPDYRIFNGDFSGSDGVDMYYGLHIDEERYGVVSGVLSYASPDGETVVSADTTIQMAGSEGILSWRWDGRVYFGVIEIQANVLVADLNGPAGSWADTSSAPVVFYPMAEETLTESCRWFSVTLPEDWAGKYQCIAKEDTLTFLHKASVEAGAGGLLFSLTAMELPEDVENAGFGGVSDMRNLCALDSGSEYRYLTVFFDQPDQTTPATDGEYREMAAFVGSVLSAVSPAPDVTLQPFDFSDLSGRYRGVTYKGDAYTLRIYEWELNELKAEIYYVSDEGDRATLTADIMMFGNDGYVSWELPEIAVGGGVLRVGHDGLSLSLHPFDGSGSFDTGGFLRLAPVE
ncbi:MAG: dockerin type I repeat-containing protein [Clostridia bacterium]|nr:dockerin type I repeat-containing protein [Clostridia bacterium]MBR0537212.1 dockerin type I repeat-containing protein [Clostridia bacterium]